MPISVTVNTEPIDRLIGQIRALETIDFAPLLEEWRGILETDNLESALAGLDGKGDPLEPVTYRPDPKAGTRKPIDYSIQANDNLTSGHYRTLDGPPLAPQGEESRVVTHYRMTDPQHEGDQWWIEASYQDVKTVSGLDLYPFHFDTPDHNPRLPVRDLTGVRPGALQKARDALVAFVRNLLQRQA